MTVTTNVDKIKINLLTQDQYDSLEKNPTELYFITDNDTRYVKTNELAEVAISGDYTDLNNTPTIPVVDQTFNDSSSNSQSGIAIKNYLDSTVVHLSGDETINGIKTFTQNIYIANNYPVINLKQLDTEQENPPETGENNTFISFTDKNGARIGSVKCAYRNDGVGYTVLVANKHDGSAGSPILGIFCDANNNSYTEAPTPETSDNSKKIATTAYVKAQGYAENSNVVHLTGDEIITGNKRFTSNVVRANTNFTKGTNPSSKTYCTVELTDKNGEGTKNRVGVFESAINTNGDIETFIGAYKYDNNSTAVEKISVTYPKTGIPYAIIPPLASTFKIYADTNNISSSSFNGWLKTNVLSTESNNYLRIGTSDGSTANSAYLDIHKTSITTPTVETSDNSTKVATTAFVKNNLENYVTTNTAQTISGSKTFTSSPLVKYGSPTFAMQMTNVTKGTKPSSTLYAICPAIYDSAGTNQANKLGQFYASITKDNLVGLTMNVFKAESGSSASSSLSIYYPASGNPYTSCPGSDVNGSIVTTINKSKASNGYLQLGNGIIINWGKTSAKEVSNGTVGTVSVTFSKSYTATPQVVTTTNNNASNANYGGVNSGIWSVSTTGFTLAIANKGGGSTSSGAFWIAIGY